jgi:ubiquitin-protein ligase
MSLPLAIKRINRDIKLCKITYAEEFQKLGIHVHFDENNTKLCYIMIYGPEKKYDSCAEKEIETPYYGGFYLFKMKFPDNYPISPPFMGFRTSFSDWRCHPNFYERSAGASEENLGGKVCLSMINTFGNQDWTPSRRISEILIQLQERFDTVPIRHEPGYEKVKNTEKRNTDYNAIIEYGNYRYAMLSLLKNPGEDFSPLLPTMRELYVSNFEKVYNKMQKFREIYNHNNISFEGAGAVKHMKFKVSMDNTIEEALKLYKSFTGTFFIEKGLSVKNIVNDDNIKNKKENPNLNDNELNLNVNELNLNVDKEEKVKPKKKSIKPNPNSDIYDLSSIYTDNNDTNWILKLDKNKNKKWYKKIE